MCKNWFSCLKKGLKDRDFEQSDIDHSVFYRQDAIRLWYIGDCVNIFKQKYSIKVIIKSLKNEKENFQLTDEEKIKRYLGVEVKNQSDVSLELIQESLIGRIIQVAGLYPFSTAPKSIPVSAPLLQKYQEGLLRKQDWNYRSLVGMLSYL